MNFEHPMCRGDSLSQVDVVAALVRSEVFFRLTATKFT